MRKRLPTSGVLWASHLFPIESKTASPNGRSQIYSVNSLCNICVSTVGVVSTALYYTKILENSNWLTSGIHHLQTSQNFSRSSSVQNQFGGKFKSSITKPWENHHQVAHFSNSANSAEIQLIHQIKTKTLLLSLITEAAQELINSKCDLEIPNLKLKIQTFVFQHIKTEETSTQIKHSSL